MITNELIFVAHLAAVSSMVLGFAILGKEALIALISIFFLLANIFVIKQIELFNFNATGADVFIIGIAFAINLLQEGWGIQISRKAIWISFSTSLLYLCMSKFHLWYDPASFDSTHAHFAILLHHSTRIIAASFTSYLIVQLFDTSVYAYIKKQTEGKYLILRNYASMLSSQLLDTFLFSFLGLYGIVDNIWHIIFVSYFIKMLAIFLTTPFIYLARPILKWHAEKTQS
jgi:hypothetical protein